jgi:hypothetical protein
MEMPIVRNDDVTVEGAMSRLMEIRQQLDLSLKYIDELIAKAPAPRPNPAVEQPPVVVKQKSLGACMFVNKRVIKEQGISNRHDLENCSQRCNSKAIHVKNGLILCSRHKDSDVSKIEEILTNETCPVIYTVELTTEMDEGSNADAPLKPGKYGGRRGCPDNSSSEEYVEAAIETCALLEKLLEQTSRTIPVRIELKELLVVEYEGVSYVIDPLGDCFGKITNEDALTALETKTKMKEYGVVHSHLVPLGGSLDRIFLETFSLEYDIRYLPRQQ